MIIVKITLTFIAVIGIMTALLVLGLLAYGVLRNVEVLINLWCDEFERKMRERRLKEYYNGGKYD